MGEEVRVERIGNATLYLGDCLEVLPTLAKVDAVITDPPYGLGDRMQGGTWGASQEMREWDQATPDAVAMAAVLASAERAVIWGGNLFTLPPSRCWLIWDKQNAVPTMGDFEMAWTNLDQPSKRFRHPVGRILNGHPTEKPIMLMRWCLAIAGAPETILDPYMGSGTCGIAATGMGCTYIGVEIHEPYFNIACERIENAQRQERLFA